MTRFCYPDKLSMDGMGFERQEIHHSCCKSTSLRRYGSFIGLVVLCHLELTDKCTLEKLSKFHCN